MVPFEREDDDVEVQCWFTKKTAGAFQLMHVFLHELGHHYDCMQTKRKCCAPSGEDYAENFANKLADRTWPAFYRRFGF